jgi:cytochrome c
MGAVCKNIRKDNVMRRSLIKLVAVSLMLTSGAVAFGDLAADSEAYCKSTAKTEITSPSVITAKVDEAIALLEEKGQDAFLEFQGTDSKFIFNGTYMWILSLEDSTMLMHPIKNKMVGKQWNALKDKNGKRFFAIMNQACLENGSGWVDYMWPKPGTKDFMRKISYVKACTFPDGTKVHVGCGLYNYSDDDVAQLKIN